MKQYLPQQVSLHTGAIILLVHCCTSVAADEVRRSPEAQDVFFAEKIEPILKRHCLGCHSHAAGQMEGGLTLDSRSGWMQGGSRGAAIVAGKPDSSLLIKAVRRSDPELSMPPDEKLSAAEVALLEEWIEHGAADPRKVASTVKIDPLDWWSLRPLVRPEIPTGHRRDQNPVDSFIDHRLHLEKLTAANRADRKTLIRRVMFDLHGLPPTPSQVESFVNDPDPDPEAYSQLVDQLLASPRYGERWARHWLDTVHFADTHGCEHDVFRPNAWRYRDYVIESFNNDTHWPRFIREQLAADYFFPEETHLTPALGFVAAGPLELSRAGTAPVTFDYLDRDDMVTQTMAAFASTTANCARCHDHKFDPVSQEDYYSLQAVFAGVGKGDVDYDSDPTVAAQRHYWTNLATRASSTAFQPDADENIDAIVAAWEEEQGDSPAVWTTLRPETFVSAEGATLRRLNDDSVLSTGELPATDTYSITAALTVKTISAVRLDVLPDDSLPSKGPGRCDNGNLHLTEVQVFLSDTESRRLKIVSAVADWDQEGWTIAHSLDGNPKTAWGIYPKVGEPHHAVFEFEKPIDLKPDSRLTVVLKQLHGGSHLIGRFKLHATSADSAAAKVVAQAVAQALQTSRDQRTPDQQSAVAAFAVRSVAEQQLAEMPAMSTVYGVSNLYSRAKKLATPMKPNVVHVLKRGSIEAPGIVAHPGALSVLTHLPGRFESADVNAESARRAALADWLASPENPLTWRSVVNRVWSYHFGRGICNTPNDFGRMGGLPSHPELLDWLAIWFRDDAQGSLKKLHRLIVLSDTYQRSSAKPSKTRDTENRFLARMNRRRLDAESFRDAVLQVCGRLDLTMGGPGVQHFTQSKGQQSTPKLDYDAFDWDATGAARRSIYRVVWRGIADPFMESLDFPDLGLLAPKRENSVSALQALALYNNDFVLHHSRVLADKLQQNYPGAEEQLNRAVRLIFLRDPTQTEGAALKAYTQKHGLAATCRVLFNGSEFLFVN